MSRYVANMTSTHNGKLLIAGESFDPVEKGFKAIDINCLLNNGRIRVDYLNEETKVVENVVKEEVKEPEVTVKEVMEVKEEAAPEVDDAFEEIDNVFDSFPEVIKETVNEEKVSKPKKKKK